MLSHVWIIQSRVFCNLPPHISFDTVAVAVFFGGPFGSFGTAETSRGEDQDSRMSVVAAAAFLAVAMNSPVPF